MNNSIDEITNSYSIFQELPFEKLIQDFQELNLIYNCAIKEVYTKLEVLSEEFKVKRQRNPIEYMKTRVKSIQSTVEKCIITEDTVNTKVPEYVYNENREPISRKSKKRKGNPKSAS